MITTIISSLIIMFISYKLFQQAAGSMALSRLNLISVTYYLWLIGLSYLGLSLAKLGVENYALKRADLLISLNKAYWAASYALIMLPLSMLFFQIFFFGGKRKIKKKLDAFYTERIVPLQTELDSAQIVFWSLITIIVLISATYCFWVLPKVPIYAILTNAPSSEVGRLRFISKFDFPGNIYIRNILFQNLSLLLCYVAYGYKKLYPNRFLLKLWFYFTVLLAFLGVTFHGEKAPLVVFIVTIFVIKGIIDGGYSKKIIIASIITAFSLIVFLYYLIDDNITFGLYGGIFSRLIMVPNAGLLLTFDIFPNVHDYLNGASFPGWVVSFFDMEHMRSARVIMETINPHGVIDGTAGVMNSLYIAEAYANFGIIGLIISPVLVGFVIQAIYNIILGAPKTPVFVALMGFFFFKLPVLGGFVDFIWNVSWIFVFTIVIFSINARYFLLLLGNRKPTLR